MLGRTRATEGATGFTDTPLSTAGEALRASNDNRYASTRSNEQGVLWSIESEKRVVKVHKIKFWWSKFPKRKQEIYFFKR